MAIETESGIPIPAPKLGNQGRARKYPLNTMAIDESFVVPEEKEHSIRCAIANFKRTDAGQGRQFVTRKTEDGGRRVWRVE